MSISRTHRGTAAAGRKSSYSRRKDLAPVRPVHPGSFSLPGTALHRLTLQVYEVEGNTIQRRGGDDAILHLRNPLEVAEYLRRRVGSLGSRAQRRLASKIAPQLAAGRTLPLALASFLVGVTLSATGRYWALPLLAYGTIALLVDLTARRRRKRALLDALDRAMRPDLQLLSSDRTRAEGIAARFADVRHLDFLDGGKAPEGVPLPQGERVLLAASGVIKARETKAGLLREAEGRLLVTSARILFASPQGLLETELNRVVRADVLDELRLVVIPSKREAAGVYFMLGNAHTFAQVIRLARQELQSRHV